MSAKVALCQYSIYGGRLPSLPVATKTLVNTINQYSLCVAWRDREFQRALTESDILLPDGISIVVSARLLGRGRLHKIAGADLHQHMLNELDQRGGRCFYLGSSVATLQRIRRRLQREYPRIDCGIHAPPYVTEFSAEDNARMIQAVNAFRPDVLFIGMTAPKQEKWAHRHKAQLDANIICSVGAVFDFYAGTVVRPHRVWVRLGLEWLVRLVREPKRLWRRYLYYGPIFVYLIVKDLRASQSTER